MDYVISQIDNRPFFLSGSKSGYFFHQTQFIGIYANMGETVITWIAKSPPAQ